MAQFLDLEPSQAVAEARRLADESEGPRREEIVNQLDRYLRAKVLAYLQSRSGDRKDLERALSRAHSWARREKRGEAASWQTLIGLLLDSRRVASRLEQMDLLTERASSILFSVIEAGAAAGPSGVRPKELAARAETSEQNVNNYLRRLEKNGLVSRFRPEGSRATYVFATARGKELADQLRQKRGAASRKDEEPRRDSGILLALEIDLFPGWTGQELHQELRVA